jgi:hypothetical protein
MTSFIELPRLRFRGVDQPSLYVNVDDIITFQAEHTGTEMGGTVVTVRDFGSEGAGKVHTYVPIGALRDMLGMLAERHGVRSWSDDTLKGWREPLKTILEEAAERERASYARASGG